MRGDKTLEIRVRARALPLTPAAVRTLSRLASFDWIVFASKNAARFFGKELRRRRLAVPRAVRIAAVGAATAAAVRAAGMRVHVVPVRSTAMDMVAALGDVRGRRVLFPRSAVAPATPVRALRSRGAHVQVLPLYVSTLPPLAASTRRALLSGRCAALVFTSPSGVHGLMRQLRAPERTVVRRIIARCIGPTTATAARKAGFSKIVITA